MAKIKAEFLLERQGKTFALLSGLLDAAHSEGLKGLDTQLLQLGDPSNGDTWIFRATVITEKGTFTGHGDASPANVSKMMVTALPRMAESRAIARALRWAVNSNVVALEELGGEDDDTPHQSAPRPAPATPAPERPAPRPQPQTGIAPPPIQNGPLLTDKQRNAIYAIAERIGMDKATIEEMCEQMYGSKPSGLSTKHASELIGKLQAQQQGAG